MKAVTLFASSGIGEYYLNQLNIDVVASNEIIPRRAELYKKLYPKSNMIVGDIRDSKIKSELKKYKTDIVIASPPCQGISIAGASRNNKLRLLDERNYLVLHSIEVIKEISPNYVLFENVPAFGKMLLPYKKEMKTVEEILKNSFKNEYIIESKILDCADYGIPQFRKRNIIKVYKKNLKWLWPEKENQITVREAIGHLPSIESSEKSNFFWHFGRKHNASQIEYMKNTPTARSAFENKVFFPKNKNGDRVKGYNTTYKRICWDKPAPTITIRNDAISSQSNVHPGRKKSDGSYSDARVLSLLELFILNSLPEEFNPPHETSEILMRQVMGECIPPLLIKKIFELI